MEPIVVVGAGQAGATVVTELRAGGYAGPITLIGAETHPPYERPPLSKAHLLGADPVAPTYVQDPQWYAAHDVDLRLGTRVTGLDLDRHLVRTSGAPTPGAQPGGDAELPYHRLVLATGSRPRRLAMADALGDRAAYLRTIEDSDRIRAAFGPGRRIVVVGAGWIGLEVAAAARAAQTEVVVMETAALPLLRALGPRAAQVFADLHRAHGVDLRLQTAVTADDLAGADLVVVGIGVAPETDLAQSAGLAVDDGILVDATLRTSHPDVYAVGDVANHDHPVLRRRVRVEHWDTAIEQAKVVAQNLLGETQPYLRLPYFFTDQYDLGMEYVGYAAGGADLAGGTDTEVVLRGDPADGPWRAYWLQAGVVAAGMHVNEWGAIEEIREQIGRPLG